MTIRPATPGDLPALREVFTEYGDWVASIGGDLCLVDFRRETEALPGSYDPILLAVESDRILGCAALRPLGPGVVEMKRLYVRPDARGLNLGRRLVEQTIEVAKARGNQTLRLDTLPTMATAIALYRKLGFQEIPPYGNNPRAALCFELAIL